MNYFLIFLIIGILALFIPNTVFGEQEQLFYGKSEFQKLPSVIYPDHDSRFELKILYNKGAYTIKELKPMIDVYPERYSSHVTITTRDVGDYLVQGSTGIIHGTITTDSTIPQGKIFLVAYFTAKDIWDNSMKSAWSTTSDPIDVEPEILKKSPCDEKRSDKSVPIKLDYEIKGGKVVTFCKRENTNSVITKIDAKSDGQITVIIPKKVVYSLSSIDCKDDSELFILMNGEEILPTKSIHTKKENIIAVEFSKGIHTMEFIGATIIPDPSPAQYCGIVMGFDSLYLPPKFQIEKGMKSEQIKCNEGLELIIRSNDRPACVKLETMPELHKRGIGFLTRNYMPYSPYPDHN
ncbi:MAG TPA: hypothetical protein VNK07_00155 [Candidatus Binatia bacterium]|nr:hypothetical protein [Candidatus Binatia bacterium]